MLLIDTDPGLDDAHAIAMAAAAVPAEEIILTTVAGNAPIDVVTSNARWLVARLCPGARVFQGAAAPLQGPAVDATDVHGADGLGGMPRFPADLAPLESTPAATAIVEAARTHGKSLQIVALAPLTNLALALALEPALPEMVGGITFFGGTPKGWGNVTANAEFNVYADPVAAEYVLQRWAGLRLVTWDLCVDAGLDADEFPSLWESGSAAARLFHAYAQTAQPERMPYMDRAQFLFPDPFTMAIALHDEVAVEADDHAVLVGTEQGPGRGTTVVDWWGRDEDRAKLRLVTRVDRAAAARHMAI